LQIILENFAGKNTICLSSFVATPLTDVFVARFTGCAALQAVQNAQLNNWFPYLVCGGRVEVTVKAGLGMQYIIELLRRDGEETGEERRT